MYNKTCIFIRDWSVFVSIQVILSFTVSVIKALLIKLEAGEIDYCDFMNHTRIKISFLTEHIGEIQDLREKILAEDIIKTYERIVRLEQIYA